MARKKDPKIALRKKQIDYGLSGTSIQSGNCGGNNLMPSLLP